VLVVSVVSLKGGVGKTSIVLGLAGAAMQRGLRSLVVDLDPQANATTVLDPPQVRFTASDVLADARGGILAQAVTQSGWGAGVDVVAAERALEHRNRPERGGETRLRVAMNGTASYDIVLVDCPPSLGELTKNGLAASRLALVITEPSLFALQGAQQALEAVEVVRGQYNLRLRPAGIVINRVRTTSAEHRYRVNELAAAHGGLLYLPPMPERSAVLQAQGACVPVQRWRSPGGRDASRIFARYLEHLLATAYDDGPLTRRRSR
jgi:chromosome partitioning protein